ncbi:MAG: glycosyltransferase family 4 protein [Acidimicrobiales bacterium]|nr:glycosyltransferase family 4 protein [Acidimicrobiales bacterium]
MAEPLLVLVAGKDPLDEPGGGHSSYVRAHARAATAAGFAPHLVAVGRDAAVRETDFGTIHRARSPHRPLRQLMIPGHARVLAREAVAVVGDHPGPVLLHGFGVWGAGAVAAADRLRAARPDLAVATAISSYTVYRAEHDSLVRGAAGEPWRERARYRAQAAWVAAVVDRWERDAYRRADRVWVNYDSVARLVVDHHGPEVQVQRIGYGPESAFEPLPPPAPVPTPLAAVAPAGTPRLVCIARHHSRKGVDVLIEALALLRDRDVAVGAALVGFGPLLEAHRRRVAALGLDDRVAVTGGVDAVEPYLAAADLFVLPSREEQSGALALLEAQRLGIAVVASAVDGIPEDVADGETGWLVPPGDAGALAEVIAVALADPAARARVGDGGRRRFAERFAAEPFAQTLAAAYAGLGIDPGG